MDEYLQQEVKELLERLDAQTDTALPPSDESQQGTEVIDVFIVRHQVEEADPPTVESTLADTSDKQETQAAPAEQETTGLPLPSFPHKPRRLGLPFVTGALCLLLVVALGIATLLTVFAPSATVTIIPISAQMTTTRMVTIVATNANASQQQVPGRLLETITLSQAKTVPATGTGRQEAQAAHGFITFYNALPASQTIPAGELLTGADGVEVVTLQQAAIPAGTLATNGQATVPARAVNVGPQGNIAADDLYGKCCRDNVFVSNSPFHGGLDARSYQMVTQQNINNAVASVKTGLDQSVRAALGQQAQPGETLVTPVPCTSTAIADHKAGEEASHVRVTVGETCTGEVYATNALHDVLMQAVTRQATGQLGEGYGPVGDIRASVTRATRNPHQGIATLQVKVISTWAYQLSQAQQDRIKLAIRGKSKEEAITLLLHTPGIQTVSISIKHGNAIPTDMQHIHLNVVLLD